MGLQPPLQQKPLFDRYARFPQMSICQLQQDHSDEGQDDQALQAGIGAIRSGCVSLLSGTSPTRALSRVTSLVKWTV
jgi:hypothetical protein